MKSIVPTCRSVRGTNLVHPLTIVLLACLSNSASAQNLECPDSVPEASIKLENTPAGWTPFVARPLYLHAAAPIDGPPQRRGELANYTEQKEKGETSYTYRFEGHYPDGKWLQCAYGEYGQITLSKRIDDHIRECKFTYRSGQKAGQRIIKIRCA
ncbi:STY0301 family protein [Rugamonas sp. CCM 8940]|uniref:STY0301 family protein n=1 Tax=Rugamonas sp. CCM 8940 TaxID=2765359 RepID=UPI0018F671E8|nr:STY0301 family protein [Rugamonas sp. CCM 8940]MBJ7312339.1 hypothetical protein [Rugamonas sp. CCM 8940]